MRTILVFFKPTWVKVFLTGYLFVLIIFPLIIASYNSLTFLLLFLHGLYFFLPLKLFTLFNIKPAPSIKVEAIPYFFLLIQPWSLELASLISFIINSIAFYLTSCTVISILNKIICIEQIKARFSKHRKLFFMIVIILLGIPLSIDVLLYIGTISNRGSGL